MSQYLCRKHRVLNASRVILLHLVECLAESIMQKNSQRGQTDECREVCRSAEQSTKKTEANFIALDLENIYPRNICVYAKCVKCVSCVQTCNVCVKGSLCHSLSFLLRQGLSLNLWATTLSGQWSPRIPLPLPTNADVTSMHLHT